MDALIVLKNSHRQVAEHVVHVFRMKIIFLSTPVANKFVRGRVAPECFEVIRLLLEKLMSTGRGTDRIARTLLN
jgi:hypothetical protein